MEALARAWMDGGGKEMRELHAAANLVADAGVAALARNLHCAPMLRSLVFGSAVGGNAIGDDGARALVQPLRLNAGRQLAVNLKHNRLSPSAADELRATARDCAPDLRVVL